MPTHHKNAQIIISKQLLNPYTFIVFIKCRIRSDSHEQLMKDIKTLGKRGGPQQQQE